MLNGIKYSLVFLVVLVGLFIVGNLMTGLDLAQYRFWGPKIENAHRAVYEETKSYRDGSRRDFENLYVAYTTATTPEDKTAVLSVAKERADGVNPESVPDNLKQLLCNQLKDCM